MFLFTKSIFGQDLNYVNEIKYHSELWPAEGSGVIFNRPIAVKYNRFNKNIYVVDSKDAIIKFTV